MTVGNSEIMGLENIPPEKRGNPAWVKGGPSPNPGGRPKALTEIQAMLDKEHRSLSKMREVYDRLRALALAGEDSAYMKLYLDRLQGPVKDLDESRQPEDMTDEEIEAALKEGN